MDTRVPNFDSFATLIDRLIIEQVKKSQLQIKLEEKLDDKQKLVDKITIQNRCIGELRSRLINYFVKSWVGKEYDFIDEERTFI